MNKKLFKQTYKFICEECGEFSHTDREYCEQCGSQNAIRSAKNKDYKEKEAEVEA